MKSNAIQRLVRACALTATLGSGLLLWGCDSKPDRSSPDSTIASAKLVVVEEGNAKRLAEFIYADSPEQRRLINRIGVFMGNIQGLATSVNEKFPEEVAALKAKAEENAKSGKAANVLSQMSMPGRRRQQTPQQRKAMQAGTQDLLSRVLVDPYGWLNEAGERLTTVSITDDTAALLWDKQPVLPPVGMVMKRGEDGLWYFVLPTNLPMLANYMPKTDKEYQIIGSMVAVFDRVMVDLKKDVDSGRIKSLDQLSREAGEKTLPPLMMVAFGYSKLMEIKQKEAKQAAAAANAAKAAPVPAPSATEPK